MTDGGWNFLTYETYITQRFNDLSLQLQQRFDAQQTLMSAVTLAAEKAVNKAEQAQAQRNESQNEFRKSLGDLSGLMWTTKEGTAALDSLRREFAAKLNNEEEKVNMLSSQYSNLQGRFAMIGIVWGVLVALASTGLQFFFRFH